MSKLFTKNILCALIALLMSLTIFPTKVFALASAVLSRATSVNASELKDGDRVVIYNSAYGKALSTVYNGYYNSGVDVTEAEGELLGYGDTEVWTVGVNETETTTTYTFSTPDGKKLSMGEQYSSMPLDDVNTEWVMEAAANDAYYVKNVVRQSYIEWYDAKNYWSGYNKINAGSEGMFEQKFYLVNDDPAPIPVEDGFASIEKLKDGDKVVLFNPAYGKTLSSTYNGFYNNGVDATVTDGTLLGYGDTEIWTLGVNETDTATTYTFSTTEGKKLSMGDQYSSMPLDDVNTEWTIEPAANDAYYVKNVVRQAYIEWYDAKNYWSGYGKINEGSEGMFELKFYLATDVPEPEPIPAEEGIVAMDDLRDGDRVVIFNKAYNKALSSEYTGNYNKGVDIAFVEGNLTGYANTEIWTVGINEADETKTFTFATSDGKKLSMGAQYSSMPLDDENPDWRILPVEGSDGYHIQNVVRNNYIEWYADKDNWSSYGKISDNNKDLFEQRFYLVTEEPEEQPTEGPLQDGEQIVIYSPNAESVMGGVNDMGVSLVPIPAVINENNTAACGNGAVVWTVGASNGVYTFETNGKYLATNNDENLYLSDTLSDTTENCTYWTLEALNGGYVMYSKTAKYYSSSVCIEFFSGYFSGWSFKSSTPELYVFTFHPLAEGTNVYNGMVNNPMVRMDSLNELLKSDDCAFEFSLDDLRDIDFKVSASYTVNGEKTTVERLENTADKKYSFLIPADVTASATSISVEILVDDGGEGYSGTFDLTVKDEVLFKDPSPVPNSETNEDKRPVISVKVFNVSNNPVFDMVVNGEKVEATFAGGLISYQAKEDMADGRTSVSVTVTREDGMSATKGWSFFVGEATEQLYFGQLHSHTQYSDGAGTLDSALAYIEALPESANIDFVSFTDHSNYFDTTSSANPEDALYDMSVASEASQDLWNSYKSAAEHFNETHSNMIAIAGFEMTWSGGPGHINTFNSPGIVSRNNATLNNKTNDAGMKAYYALLSRPEGSDTLSQFNHPGNTFGTFSDFSYWDALLDTRIFMVEVGNGEGQIGQGGYYPSYEYYTMALDKGWHVAPTNNQDNHKGRWGNANDARDVILTDDFSEQGLYSAIRQLKMYATEDKNLEIYYNVNGLPLGSSIVEIPEELNFKVNVSDPDASDSIAKVELIVNSGKSIYTWNDASEIAKGELTCTLAPDYSYYYVRVTESDGDIAVTSPVWVGETLKIGISSLESSVAMPVTNEELTLTTTLFNSESSDATIKSVIYTTNGSVVIGTDTTGYTLPASSSLEIPFKYTPTQARVTKVTATVVLEQDGKEFTYSKDITLDVLDADKLVYIGIDASHQNEYVNGNYKDSMGNFGGLAAEYSIRTVQLNTSEDLINACNNDKFKAIILTAPSRRDGIALRKPYNNYSDEEINALVAFNDNNGILILAGWSDYYENYEEFPADDHMAAQQNKLLAALGSKLRISDDGVNDNELNGGQSQRLYFSTYDFDNPLNEGVIVDEEHPHDRLYTEVFSHYGGASIYVVDENGTPTTTIPDTVTPVVYGHASTFSTQTDGVGIGGENVPKYTVGDGDARLMMMASEQIEGKGLIIVSGAAFMSNFEVQASISSGTSDADQQLNYSNYRICENLVKSINSATIDTIATVKAITEEGYKFTIEGIVTSNASGYDKDTAFFDCIYIEDETGGLCIFPVSGNFKVGDKVRVTGTTDWYQGEPELQVISITLINEGNEIAPKEVTAAQINDLSVLGSLIKLKGTIVSHEIVNGLVQTIMVKDANGDVARVFIDGYISTANEVKNLADGNEIEVIGLSSYDDTFNAPEGPFPRIRVRNRDDVIITEPPVPTEFTVIASAGYNGTIDPAGTFTVADGETVVFKLTPDEGYVVEEVLVNGISVPVTDNTFTVIVTSDLSIKAFFRDKAETCKVNLVTEGIGEATLLGLDTVKPGTAVTVAYQAPEGNVIDKLLVNGEEVEYGKSSTLVKIDTDTEIKVIFRQLHLEFYNENWYENGEKQGVYGDIKNVWDTQYENTERGREIYDPRTDAWYWLDALYNGHVAKEKEVWMPYIFQDEVIGSTQGKWVRYDSLGRMIKGWYINREGNVYYYDKITGAMAKGDAIIDGKAYYFDPITGIRQK